MPNCGKWPEVELLLYLEGKSSHAAEIDAHLRECDGCLDFILEENRVTAAMEAGRAEHVRLPAYLGVLKRESGPLFWEVSSGEVLSAAAVSHRGGAAVQPGLEAFFPEASMRVRVFPLTEGRYWVELEGAALKENTLSLTNSSGGLIYSRKSGESLALIKGVAPGRYRLSVGKEEIVLNIEDAGVLNADH